MKRINKSFLVVSASLLITSCMAGCGTNNKMYEVLFKNYDETLLYQTTVKHGKDAVYVGETPTRPEDGSYQYVFTGWDKPLTQIKSNMTFIAQYDKTNDFVVRFYDYDGKTLLQTSYVKSGETAKYEKEEPSRAATLDYYYEFKGWDKSIENVTSNLDVTAVYDEKSNIEDFEVDFEFKVDQGASEYNKETTNYLGAGEGVTASLVKPVMTDKGAVKTRDIDFDDMTFDYSKVDLSVWDEFEITLTYGGVSKNDLIDVIPDYNNWHNDTHFNFGGKYMEPGPDWLIITYLDLFDEGAMINGYPGEFSGDYYHYEFLEDGKTIRFYSKFNGGSADVIYGFDGENLLQYNGLGDEVMTIQCIADVDVPFPNPSSLEVKIYKSFDDATSGYCTAYGDGNVLTPKYDYDPGAKSIHIHIPGYPRPFVYDETDGNYHMK